MKFQSPIFGGNTTLVKKTVPDTFSSPKKTVPDTFSSPGNIGTPSEFRLGVVNQSLRSPYPRPAVSIGTSTKIMPRLVNYSRWSRRLSRRHQ